MKADALPYPDDWMDQLSPVSLWLNEKVAPQAASRGFGDRFMELTFQGRTVDDMAREDQALKMLDAAKRVASESLQNDDSELGGAVARYRREVDVRPAFDPPRLEPPTLEQALFTALAAALFPRHGAEIAAQPFLTQLARHDDQVARALKVYQDDQAAHHERIAAAKDLVGLAKGRHAEALDTFQRLSLEQIRQLHEHEVDSRRAEFEMSSQAEKFKSDQQLQEQKQADRLELERLRQSKPVAQPPQRGAASSTKPEMTPYQRYTVGKESGAAMPVPLSGPLPDIRNGDPYDIGRFVGSHRAAPKPSPGVEAKRRELRQVDQAIVDLRRKLAEFKSDLEHRITHPPTAKQYPDEEAFAVARARAAAEFGNAVERVKGAEAQLARLAKKKRDLLRMSAKRFG